MEKRCTSCSSEFTVRDKDLKLLEQIAPVCRGRVYKIPPPQQCPTCRERLRMAWRNEVKLFVRNCDFSGERLISIYPPGTAFPVYRHREWCKDHNDSTRFALDYQAGGSVFEKIAELGRVVPRFHVYNFQEELDVNSQYTNCAGSNKNSYLIFAAGYNEQCLYGRYMNRSFNCVDMFFAENCRSCYDSTDLSNCESVYYCSQCSECHDSWFLYDCRGCSDCICCAGLRRKRHCIFNEQLSPEAYASKRRELGLDTRSGLESLRTRFNELRFTVSHRASHGESNQNSSGDYLWNTKNCHHCFDSRNAEDCAYCTFFIDGRDCMDVYSWGEMELCYQVSGGGSFGMYHCAFTANSYGCKECYYLDHCIYCTHCFGCVGLNRKSYCLFNRQYSKDEYEKLLPLVLLDMVGLGEWGRFFPGGQSPFPYNHSAAFDYYPLEQKDAAEAGFRWSDYEAPVVDSSQGVKADQLPDRVLDYDDSILSELILCRQSGKSFKLTKAEISFYRDNNLPPPVLHPEERQRRRLESRNPRRLWDRDCSGCGQSLQSTYDPGRTERVLCDPCYRKEIY